MKIRNGFVSNSSSSSFVIIGTKVNSTYEDIEKITEDKELVFKSSDEDGEFIIGVGVSYIDHDDMSEDEIDLPTKKEVIDILATAGIITEDIKIYFGVQQS